MLYRDHTVSLCGTHTGPGGRAAGGRAGGRFARNSNPTGCHRSPHPHTQDCYPAAAGGLFLWSDTVCKIIIPLQRRVAISGVWVSGWWAGCGSRIFAHRPPPPPSPPPAHLACVSSTERHCVSAREKCASWLRNADPPHLGQKCHEMGRHKCS